MHHTREEVIHRTVREYQSLDELVANLGEKEWERLVCRPETKDPWTVKDTLAHITHWKADVIRSIKHQRRSPEEQGLETNAANHLIYIHWHHRKPEEVLAWHRQVQIELISALRTAPEAWFTGRERRAEWPYDLDGHSAFHRSRDIEKSLKTNAKH